MAPRGFTDNFQQILPKLQSDIKLAEQSGAMKGLVKQKSLPMPMKLVNDGIHTT